MKNLKNLKNVILLDSEMQKIIGGQEASLAGVYTCDYRNNNTGEKATFLFSDANGTGCPVLNGYTRLGKTR